MTLSLGLVTVLVRAYDEAIAYFVDVLGFALVQDTPMPDGKRWVVVAPDPAQGTQLLLARAVDAPQASRIGNQTGGRVFLFLYTDNFERDYSAFVSRGVEFVRGPVREAYGTVAVFRDVYGNQWDLIERQSAVG